MIQHNGYKEFERLNGSKVYICDFCIEIAYGSSKEEDIIAHLMDKHKKEFRGMIKNELRFLQGRSF